MNRNFSIRTLSKIAVLATSIPLIAFVVVALTVPGCGGDDHACPGHVDTFRGPGLVIQTSDGSATIASVGFQSDPKAVVGTSPCSYFSIDKPDASVSNGYSRVTVYMISDIFIDSVSAWEPAPCKIDVMSVDGQLITVTATMDVRHKVTQHCIGNYNCCSKTELEWLGSREFDPSVVTVPFAQSGNAPIDGSTDSPQLDLAAGLDGGIDAFVP